MADANIVVLIGNLTKDPEIRYTPSGRAVGTIRMATNRKFTSKEGEREETCYVELEVWGKTAENCGQYLAKGSPVYVEGRLKYDEWESDGAKRSKLVVSAQRVQFLGKPRNNDRGDDPAAAYPGEKHAGADTEQDFPSDDDNIPLGPPQECPF